MVPRCSPSLTKPIVLRRQGTAALWRSTFGNYSAQCGIPHPDDLIIITGQAGVKSAVELLRHALVGACPSARQRVAGVCLPTHLHMLCCSCRARGGVVAPRMAPQQPPGRHAHTHPRGRRPLSCSAASTPTGLGRCMSPSLAGTLRRLRAAATLCPWRAPACAPIGSPAAPQPQPTRSRPRLQRHSQIPVR